MSLVELPSWMPAHGVFTLFAYLATFFVCGNDLASTEGSFIAVIGRFISFQACSGIPDWVSFSLFILLTFPWLLILASFVFSNTVTTVVGGILGTIVGIIGWLTA